MQLSQDTVDELETMDGAPAGELSEGGVRAAGNSRKGYKQCQPSVWYCEQMGGKVRGITKGCASLSEGRRGRDSKRRLGEGIPGKGGGLHMP
eukprot:3226642-Pleurochrysis_carterae.AAC.1